MKLCLLSSTFGIQNRDTTHNYIRADNHDNKQCAHLYHTKAIMMSITCERDTLSKHKLKARLHSLHSPAPEKKLLNPLTHTADAASCTRTASSTIGAINESLGHASELCDLVISCNKTRSQQQVR